MIGDLPRDGKGADDEVAFLEVLHAWSNLMHLTDELVAQDEVVMGHWLVAVIFWSQRQLEKKEAAAGRAMAHRCASRSRTGP